MINQQETELKVLAVDDDPIIREMIRCVLEPAGFRVHTADDGIEGIETLEDIHPDVVITNINMPRLDGFGFINAVRAKTDFQTTPILVLTTEAAVELKIKARKAGATGWIVKPFDPKKLIKALNMVAG